MATDESGWLSNSVRDHGYSLVWQAPRRRGMRKAKGRSYRKNDTCVYARKGKRPHWRINVLLTLSLNPTRPVVHWSWHLGTTDSRKFLEFVQNRVTPRGIQYDMLDRHPIHIAVKKLHNEGLPSIKEALARKQLQADLLPTAHSQYQPIEQAFNFIDGCILKNAPKYASGGQWQLDNMVDVISKAISNIDHKMVCGWYRESFRKMYPTRRIPLYLRDVK